MYIFIVSILLVFRIENAFPPYILFFPVPHLSCTFSIRIGIFNQRLANI